MKKCWDPLTATRHTANLFALIRLLGNLAYRDFSSI